MRKYYIKNPLTIGFLVMIFIILFENKNLLTKLQNALLESLKAEIPHCSTIATNKVLVSYEWGNLKLIQYFCCLKFP